MTEDAADLTIDMKTKVAAWSEVAGSYAMDFGKAALRQPAQRVRSRGFWGDIVDVGKDVLNAATGDFDIDEGVTFAVNVGKAGQKTNILTDTKGRFSIDCIDCYITGSWEVQGHIEVYISWRALIASWLTYSPGRQLQASRPHPVSRASELQSQARARSHRHREQDSIQPHGEQGNLRRPDPRCRYRSHRHLQARRHRLLRCWCQRKHRRLRCGIVRTLGKPPQ